MKRLVLLFVFLILPQVCLADSLPITSDYGWRNDPITGEWRFHSGLDLGYEYGSGIPALFDGVVVFVGNNDDGYGNQVVLYHEPYDCYTRYAHCSYIYVNYMDRVVAGQTIAAVGSTGRSTGPHLHLEYIVSDGNGGYMFANPLMLWY